MSTPCEDMYGMPSGFTAILLQFSFAYWMTTYPIIAANWHVGKFGGAAGGQGGQNGEEGGGDSFSVAIMYIYATHDGTCGQLMFHCISHNNA